MGESKCWKQIGIQLSTFGVILIVIIQNSERAGFFKFSPVFLVRGIRMFYPTDFFIRIFYEKPFNHGLFQKKMRIKFFQVYNEVSKI